MDPSYMRDLFTRYLDARRETQAAKGALDTFNTLPDPERPDRVEDVCQWVAYEEKAELHVCRRNELAAAREERSAVVQVMEEELVSALPVLVWFRHQTVGIGINIGSGGILHVQVAFWAERMPELDPYLWEGPL